MNIDDLTLGQIKSLSSMLQTPVDGLNDMVGKTVIIRTHYACVWFGFLYKKAGNEVILTDARRMWKWWAAKSTKSISLSGVVANGIIQEKSKIAPAIESVWLEAIEILPISGEAMLSIWECPDAEAE